MTVLGDPIPDEHHVARWCRAMDVQDQWPKVSAFYPRKNEPDLSGNWLEYFPVGPAEAINKIRRDFPMDLTVGSRFVVLQVEEAIKSIIAGGGHEPTITWSPDEGNQSHASIVWANIHQTHQLVASELLTRITSGDIYPGKVA